MSGGAGRLQQWGAGPLARAAGAVYWVFVLEILFVLAGLPTWVAFVFLERDRSNIPLYALALVPLGPALSALLFAWRAFLRDSYPVPARHFVRGYRLNWLDVLKVWVPILAFFTIITMNLTFRDVTGLPDLLVVASIVLAAGVAVWSCHVVLLSSLYSFPVIARARLALYHLASRPLVAIGNLSLLLASAGVVVLWSDWVLVLLASVMAWFWLRTAYPVVRDTEEHFVTPPAR